MSNHPDADPFFQDIARNKRVNKDDLVVELPSHSPSPYPEKIPSGYDPMGEIYLRGRAMRSLASGRIPWWIIMSGWVLVGVPTLCLLSLVLQGHLEILPVLLIFGIFISILWRGTVAKRAAKNRRR